MISTSDDSYGWLIWNDSFLGRMQIVPGNAVFLISNDWNSDDDKIFWIIGKKLICPSALFKIFRDSMTSQSDFSLFRFSDFSSFWRSFANKSESLMGFSNWFLANQMTNISSQSEKSQFDNLPNGWTIFDQKSFIFIIIARSFLFCISKSMTHKQWFINNDSWFLNRNKLKMHSLSVSFIPHVKALFLFGLLFSFVSIFSLISYHPYFFVFRKHRKFSYLIKIKLVSVCFYCRFKKPDLISIENI